MHSLRFRLLSASIISISSALIIAFFLLLNLFENHVERRFHQELESHLRQLIGRLEVHSDERVHLSGELADPRFNEPLSGLYWQVMDNKRPTLLRSQSLWDGVIKLPDDTLLPDGVHEHRLTGPKGGILLVLERQVILRAKQQIPHYLRVVTAIDIKELSIVSKQFAKDIFPYLAALAFLLIMAAWIQVYMGLSPLDKIRRGILYIRSGHSHRLQDKYPDEVMPLINEINELLQSRDTAVDKAKAWTADLSHGLKTPLSALMTDAQRVREQGHSAIAEDLEHLALMMRARVDRELIRARLHSTASLANERCDAVIICHKIIKTLKRTPYGSHKLWLFNTPEKAMLRIQKDDLTELLGNLLDNAAKWAQKNIQIGIQTAGERITITIEDDGPGVALESLASLGQRGLRLDEKVTGSGLGLAIVSDIIEAYKGKINYSISPLGGLCIVIVLYSTIKFLELKK